MIRSRIPLAEICTPIEGGLPRALASFLPSSRDTFVLRSSISWTATRSTQRSIEVARPQNVHSQGTEVTISCPAPPAMVGRSALDRTLDPKNSASAGIPIGLFMIQGFVDELAS